MFSDLYDRLKRMKLWNAVVLMICLASSLGSAAYYVSGSEHPGDEILNMLGPNSFDWMVAPLLLCTLAFGWSSHTDFERVRSSASREFRSNMVWLFMCAVLVTAVTALFYSIFEFVVLKKTGPGATVHAVLLIVLHVFMEAVFLSLIQTLLVNMGLRWGHALPPFLGILFMSNFIFATWNTWVLDVGYYFLDPVGFEVPVIVMNKVFPFISTLIVLLAVNWLAYSRRDRLGER